MNSDETKLIKIKLENYLNSLVSVNILKYVCNRKIYKKILFIENQNNKKRINSIKVKLQNYLELNVLITILKYICNRNIYSSLLEEKIEKEIKKTKKDNFIGLNLNKETLDIVFRVYYRNGSRYYISNTGKTFSQGNNCGTINSYHCIVSFYYSTWRITIPFYIILEDSIHDQIDKDDDMITFYYSPEYETFTKKTNLLGKSKKINNKMFTDPLQTIIVNNDERSFHKGKKLLRTVYFGTTSFLKKYEMFEKNELMKYKTEKKPDVSHIKDNEYWFMKFNLKKSSKPQIKIIKNKDLENMLNLESIHKRILEIRTVLYKEIKQILIKDNNIHKKLENIEKNVIIFFRSLDTNLLKNLESMIIA